MGVFHGPVLLFDQVDKDLSVAGSGRQADQVIDVQPGVKLLCKGKTIGYGSVG